MLGKPMTLDDLAKALEKISAPNQGLSYEGSGARRGEWAYDPYTGKELMPEYREARLTLYSSRADTVLRLIENGKHLAAELRRVPAPSAEKEAGTDG